MGTHNLDFNLIEGIMELAISFGDFLTDLAFGICGQLLVPRRAFSKDLSNLDKLCPIQRRYGVGLPGSLPRGLPRQEVSPADLLDVL